MKSDREKHARDIVLGEQVNVDAALRNVKKALIAKHKCQS